MELELQYVKSLAIVIDILHQLGKKMVKYISSLSQVKPGVTKYERIRKQKY